MRIEYADLIGLRGKTTLVSGGFDPLHVGHVQYLQRASQSRTDRILCALSSDQAVAVKHPPVLLEDERALLVDSLLPRSAYLYVVDPVPDETLHEALARLIRHVRPVAYVKGADWQGHLPKPVHAAVTECGVRMRYLPLAGVPPYSSSQILQRWVTSCPS